MRYIGPFFRMNSLSQKEINGQLFHLSKEAVRTLVLESKCGLVSSIKQYKKLPSSIDVTTIGNFSPLLCMYKKSSPNYIHNKNSNGFDEDTFRKEICPTTNALMTSCILELIAYYDSFKEIDPKFYSISEVYKKLSREQLKFYSVNLRNPEGVFIDKKNLLENNYKGFNLIDKSKKFKFSDQAFMMVSYYLYSKKFPDDEISQEYSKFSLEILEMFLNFKEKIYECSFEEICKTLLAINLFYKYSENVKSKDLIIDLTDFLINKFDEKDYYVDSLDFTSLFVINLILSYKHTKIISFNEKSKEIISKLATLYDENKEIFLKLSGKKDIKYSCLDINFYFLAFMIFSNENKCYPEYKNMLSSLYRKYYISSGLIPSWPDAPTLDDRERYRGLTLNSSDMLDESYFRMPNLSSPNSSGVAPIFNKTITYSKKKDSFDVNTSSFDSYRNMFSFYLFILLFKDDFISEISLNKLPINNTDTTASNNNLNSNIQLTDDNTKCIISDNVIDEHNTQLDCEIDDNQTIPVSSLNLDSTNNIIDDIDNLHSLTETDMNENDILLETKSEI
ncbi:hypothetical protein [Clostridium sp.]|uniref:hypothetical protein n=1 Tax=Clostridium sp. TaxID=1506 RepID=UPI003FA558B9